MKKLLIGIISLVSLFTIINISNAASIQDLKKNIENIQVRALERFTDVTKDSWFLRNVALLSETGIINGYEDKTFRPNDKVTKAQFVKMVITALGYVDIAPSSDYWARAYINKAQDLKILDRSVPVIAQNYDVPIPRSEMAIIVVRAMMEEYSANLNSYASLIKDYDTISDLHKNYVLNAYSKGIITGYEDGEFKPNGNLTRAEAAVVIIRMLDTTERKPVELK